MGGRETRDMVRKKKKTTPKKTSNPSSAGTNEKVKVVDKVEKENEKSNHIGKKRKKDKISSIDDGKAIEIVIADNSSKKIGEKKRKKAKKNKRDEQIHGDNAEEGFADDEVVANEVEEVSEKSNPKGKKRRKGNGKAVEIAIEDNSKQIVGEKKKEKKLKKDKVENEERIVQVHDHGDTEKGNPKKAKKKKKNDQVTNKGVVVLDETDKVELDEVYHISSGDEDNSKGMKKWITEYHQSRQGLKVLQQNIDEFITAHEAKLEQERKEREARDEAEGWTVVSHHKGRKKTTDSESGLTMGAVSLAAASEFREEKEKKLMKKKQTEALPEFYRFQRKEAQMSEILSLQSKFEQDKKKIQQLRAARKFRPY
ncbi:hypothetical protein ACFE04_014423 [Oxalis oulophora]